MQKRIYISIPLLLLALGSLAQTSNPFDLKWRSKTPAPTELETEAKDTQLIAIPVNEAAVDTVQSGMKDVVFLDSGNVSDSENISEMSITDGSASVVSALDAPSDDSVKYETSPDGSALDGSVSDKDALGGSVSGEPEYDNSQSSVLIDGESTLPGHMVEKDKETSASSTDDRIVPSSRRQITPVANIGLGLFLILYGLALIILTWAVNINRGFLQKIYRAALNENFSALLLREQRFASSQYLYYIVYAVFFLNGGLFLYLVSRYATWDFGHRDTTILVFIGFLALVYTVKHFVTRVLGETFQISKEMRHYNFNIILYNILAGIALMPVNLFLAFGPTGMRMPLIYTGLGVIAIMYLMRQSRGIIMGYHLIVKDVFQFFVYLCAIEILPVLVLFKYFPN